ncbi:hypothetical protein Tco_0772667 [Tanacetum coccineum]|uniref:Uncharacterized protein n=1 Tax=Tanacetum coccineum TaxID=301880 RepID=A0ABQ4ZL50_9ASTR
MACSLPHTDFEVEALVRRLINEDKGRQDVLLNLAFQFEDSCAVRDDLRKTYEKCNDISQESRALICTLLKESSEKDRELHLSMYGKAAQLQKQMDAKSAWFQEKYSGRTHGGIGCSSSQTDFPLTEKELHQLRMDEEALKEMLEEEAMNKKAQEEKIRQEQAENDAFFLEFGVLPQLSVKLRSALRTAGILATLRSGFFVYGGLHEDVNLLLSTIPGPQVWLSPSSGLSSDASDAYGPGNLCSMHLSLWVHSSSWECSRPVAGVKVSPSSSNWVAWEVGESILLGMECPVAASCSGELSDSNGRTSDKVYIRGVHIILGSGAGVDLYALILSP